MAKKNPGGFIRPEAEENLIPIFNFPALTFLETQIMLPRVAES